MDEYITKWWLHKFDCDGLLRKIVSMDLLLGWPQWILLKEIFDSSSNNVKLLFEIL
jgi:hypothetical protein